MSTIRDACQVVTISSQSDVVHFALGGPMPDLICFVCGEDRATRHGLTPATLESLIFYAGDNRAMADLRAVFAGVSRKGSDSEGRYVAIGACARHTPHIRQLFRSIFRSRVVSCIAVNFARNQEPEPEDHSPVHAVSKSP